MTRQLSRPRITYVALMLLAVANTAESQPLADTLHSVEGRWAKAAYETVGRQQGKDLRALLNDVRLLHKSYPDRPEAAAWHGIVARTYRDIKGSATCGRPDHPEADIARKLEVENLLAKL